ncbi:MAG: bifunctional oligoribonuclease/PAP phosphatase NrnA [Clostridia bacterium]|nr:bifunctional oligoribonuclease/PAP phosphatase NrnA [Clostridia bacterium]
MLNLDKMQTILNKIKENDKIFIFRHFRPDGDAVGSSKGLAAILKLTYPEKKIYLQNADFSGYLSFLGGEDEILPDEEYADALGIVVDTATQDRISNKKYSLCRELIKIDHHIPIESYAPTEWVEEERSSTCEMIAHFYDTFRHELKIDVEAATYIYTGMVTDSGRFRFRDVSGETLRLAGTILSVGVDTDTLFAHLYLKEFDELKFEAYVHKKMKITEGGVAYIYVDNKMKEQFGLSDETAGNVVSLMDSIKGSIIWLAFIENKDGSTRVRLRSRFVTVSELANKYHGGGHACASGATVYSRKEMNQLIKDADSLIKEYKANNDGWM